MIVKQNFYKRPTNHYSHTCAQTRVCADKETRVCATKKQIGHIAVPKPSTETPNPKPGPSDYTRREESLLGTEFSLPSLPLSFQTKQPEALGANQRQEGRLNRISSAGKTTSYQLLVRIFPCTHAVAHFPVQVQSCCIRFFLSLSSGRHRHRHRKKALLKAISERNFVCLCVHL